MKDHGEQRNNLEAHSINPYYIEKYSFAPINMDRLGGMNYILGGLYFSLY
jgi:hypothetical protein